MKILVTLLIAAALAPGAAADELTLEAALEAAFADHPRLMAADAETRAAQSDAHQLGAWTNPSAFLRVEDAPRDGDLWNDAGRIVGLAQPLSVFGARGAARQVGQAQADVAAARAAAERTILEADVRRAYADARHAQQALTMRTEVRDAASRMLSLVQQRVEAGDAARVSLLRARRAFSIAEVELRTEHARLEAALSSLSSLMARPLNTALILAPSPRLAMTPGAPSALLQVALAEVEAAGAGVTLAGRERWPELELEAGLRSSPEGDGFDAGIRMALPLWDRGGARLRAARARLAAGRYTADAVELDLSAARESALARRTGALTALEQVSSEVVPDAEAALVAMQAAYAAGDADLSEVLLVSGEWVDARLVEIHWARALAMAEADLVALR